MADTLRCVDLIIPMYSVDKNYIISTPNILITATCWFNFLLNWKLKFARIKLPTSFNFHNVFRLNLNITASLLLQETFYNEPNSLIQLRTKHKNIKELQYRLC